MRPPGTDDQGAPQQLKMVSNMSISAFLFATLPVLHGQKYPPLVQAGAYRPETTGYGQVIPQSVPGPAQAAFVCSPGTGLGVIDVDDPGKHWQELSEVKAWLDDRGAKPYTTRGDHAHYYIDARGVTLPGACSPLWGDWKYNGYVIAPGGMHPSGMPYERGPGDVVQADAELAEAIAEDVRWAAEMRDEAPGTGTPGAVTVMWQEGIAAASVSGRIDLLTATMVMFERGLQDDEIRRELERIHVDRQTGASDWRPWNARDLDKLLAEGIKKSMRGGGTRGGGSGLERRDRESWAMIMEQVGTTAAEVMPVGAPAPRAPQVITDEAGVSWPSGRSIHPASWWFTAVDAAGRPVQVEQLDGTAKPKACKFRAQGYAADLLARRPMALAVGDESSLWTYDRGTWRRDMTVVRDDVARELGDGYEKVHAGRAEDAVRSLLRELPQVNPAVPHPFLLRCRNGLVDVRTKVLYAHDHRVMSTVMFPVSYDRRLVGAHPVFSAFLSAVLHPEDVPLMWRCLAYTLLPGNPQGRMIIPFGSGGNGKGTLLTVLRALIGDGGYSALTLEEMSNPQASRFRLMTLLGKVANLGGDEPDTFVRDTAGLKKATGDDDLIGEYKGGAIFTFRAHAVPWFSYNSLPQVADTSAGWYRRAVPIEFPRVIKGDYAKHVKAAVLGGELDAIFATLAELMADDLDLTPRAEASRAYRAASDPVSEFAEECLILDPSATTSNTAVVSAWAMWAAGNGHPEIGPRRLWPKLRNWAAAGGATIGEGPRTTPANRIPGDSGRQVTGIRLR